MPKVSQPKWYRPWKTLHAHGVGWTVTRTRRSVIVRPSVWTRLKHLREPSACASLEFPADAVWRIDHHKPSPWGGRGRVTLYVSGDVEQTVEYRRGNHDQFRALVASGDWGMVRV